MLCSSNLMQAQLRAHVIALLLQFEHIRMHTEKDSQGIPSIRQVPPDDERDLLLPQLLHCYLHNTVVHCYLSGFDTSMLKPRRHAIFASREPHIKWIDESICFHHDWGVHADLQCPGTQHSCLLVLGHISSGNLLRVGHLSAACADFHLLVVQLVPLLHILYTHKSCNRKQSEYINAVSMLYCMVFRTVVRKLAPLAPQLPWHRHPRNRRQIHHLHTRLPLWRYCMVVTTGLLQTSDKYLLCAASWLHTAPHHAVKGQGMYNASKLPPE